MSKPVPNFEYPSSRLVGIELEIDPGRSGCGPIEAAEGWSSKGDGSLSCYGCELVLEPAVPLSSAREAIERQCASLKNINVKARGGFHVHVQTPSESLENIWQLTLWYAAAQEHINKLVGQSRINNRFAMPYDGRTRSAWKDLFQLDQPASNRQDAKGSRQYWCVNPAMWRCRRHTDRSIEFRQGSISKRAFVVYGWACLMTCLVDLAARKPAPNTLSWGQFKAEIAEQTEIAGGHGMAEWLEWRQDYLHGNPSLEMINKLVSVIGTSRVGMYGASRKLDVSLPFAKKLLAEASRRGVLSPVGNGTYKPGYDSFAEADLAQLEIDALQMELTPTMPVVPGVTA